MKVISKNQLPQALDILAAASRVLAPMQIEGVTRFAPWGQAGESALGVGNTLIPPKDVLFPQSEKLFQYQVTGEGAEIEPVSAAAVETVIFGIRPCDVRSIQALDQVFLTRGYADETYQVRRDHTLLVALGCSQPLPTCFCASMGIDPLRADGADVMMWDLGDVYGLEGLTDKGKTMLQAIAVFTTEADQKPPAATGKFTLEVDMDGVPAKLHQMFEHPIWDRWYQKCLGCGTCTFLCPTCHCFDVQEKSTGQWDGYRFRCWDSCMFPEYTVTAGGHNPRPSKKERLRNRFMHKLCYFPERYGMLMCTGCGRCVRECGVNMDITKFIKEVREAVLDA
jgi:ferredoxin